MLVPPVVQSAGRQVGGDSRMAQNNGPATATTLWPLPQSSLSGNQAQGTPPLAATPAPAHNQGINRYELYSLFPGSGGGASYVAATPGTPAATPARAYHATTHKVSESVFSAAVGVGVGGYTWGAPTPPPGSPYSPVPGVTQLEFLTKNLASIGPHHATQPLSLQGVGVNVGTSVHHHAQHTQHTLNLAGLHHLHHGESTMTTTSATSFTSKFIDERTLTLGGIHQGTFSPQLSLVTTGTPTLAINSFSPNSQASMAQAPGGGVLLQEYQSSPVAACPSSTSSSAIPTAGATCSVSTVVVQDAQAGSTFVQSMTKKRESFVTAQAQTSIKLENQTRQSCLCKSTNVAGGKTKIVHSEAGCSRTLPVVSSWNSQDTSSYSGNNHHHHQSVTTNFIKREPLPAVPCQVAEVSTSLHATTTAVKIEPLPPKSENGIVVSTATGTGIPVGIAVARQRLQHQETSSTSMRNVSLSHHTSHHASYHHFQPDSLGSATAMTMGGATLVHCGPSGDDRPAHLAIPSGTLTAPSTINGTLGTTPGAWPPTLWQYPTAAMPALEPVGFPQLGVGLQGGLQLVRDPSTGHLLLIHAAAEQMQQAVVWPNYSNHSTPSVGAPSFLLPGPTPPSLPLISDINGARLVLTDTKRKQQSTVPIVKIEADCGTPATTIIAASAESTKALQTMTTMTGALMPETPLLTTLHYYPHAPTLVQINQSESTQNRHTQRSAFISKATSPVSYLTPPPDVTPTPTAEAVVESTALGVQDASNQTDAPETEEEADVKLEQRFTPCQQVSSFDLVSSTIEKPQTDAKTEIAPPRKLETTSVERTIERVASCQSSEDISEPAEEEEERLPRLGTRVIEITEENCDSFHENLEFFGRRRDPVEQHRRPHFSEELFKKEKMMETIRNQAQEVIEESNDQICQPVSSTLKSPEQADSVPVISEDSQVLPTPEEPSKVPEVDSSSTADVLEPAMSRDMPSIDCEDEQERVVAVNQVKSLPEKVNRGEKTQSGIENVIEKLKKNAEAALNESAAAERLQETCPATETTPVARSVGTCLPRKVENGLKKHLLRIFESSMHESAENSPVRVSNPRPPVKKTISDTESDDTKGKTKSAVDLSGLELLSNSIAQLEQLHPPQSAAVTPTDDSSPSKDKMHSPQAAESNNNTVNSPLGMLCALAEQRFIEEVGEPRPEGNSEDVAQVGRLLMSLSAPEDRPALKKPPLSDENTSVEAKKVAYYAPMCDGEDADDDYTDSEPENAVKRIPKSLKEHQTSLGNTLGDKSLANGDTVEQMDMRERLADIQKKLRDKQRELTKLSPRKDEQKSPGKVRESRTEALEVVVPEQTLDKPATNGYELPDINNLTCNANLVKICEPRSHIKLLDSIPSIATTAKNVSEDEDDDADEEEEDEDDEEEEEEEEDSPVQPTSYDTSSPVPTIDSLSSAKKRKVGRPRKLMCPTSARHLTETLVSKKSRSKSSLVGYVLNSKSRHPKFSNKSGYTPLPFKCTTKAGKITKTRVKPIKQTPLHNKSVISSIIAEKAKLSQDAKLERAAKVKPKARQSREWAPEDDWTFAEDLPLLESPPVVAAVEETPVTEVAMAEEAEERTHVKKKKRKSSSSSPSRHKSERETKRRKSSDCRECAKAARAERIESIANKCKLTAAHLAVNQMRVLTAMGGLFYAGRLSAIDAPDIYAITLDGERGNRPHIHSREEILRDAIVEVCPTSTKELVPGTRLCAYWSQQYRCLYPGTSVEPSEPDSELDEKFVSVEFDDGDSGRIALDDIRLLQPDYPVVEYDPNPLLTLGKRRRQTSTTSVDEKRPGGQETDEKSLEEYRERKRLKKRRRDKIKQLQEASCHDSKRKHRRHKCCEEHRKHRHRKHRKHKHKHHHAASYSEGSHHSGGESSGQPSEGEIISDSPSVLPVVQVQDEQRDVSEAEQEVEKVEKPKKSEKKAKTRERQESVESRSKMAAFLPARQLWGWSGKGYRRPGAKGRAKKQFFKAIQRGSEAIQIGDSAVFLSTGRPDRPYIGRIESMWETTSSNMIVKVKWFYHPEETVGCPASLKYPGALFESPHMDENDVQTISHKCEVLPLEEYTEKLGKEPHRYLTIYDNNDIYYLAGYYDPTTYLLTLQPGVVSVKS